MTKASQVKGFGTAFFAGCLLTWLCMTLLRRFEGSSRDLLQSSSMGGRFERLGPPERLGLSPLAAQAEPGAGNATLEKLIVAVRHREASSVQMVLMGCFCSVGVPTAHRRIPAGRRLLHHVRQIAEGVCAFELPRTLPGWMCTCQTSRMWSTRMQIQRTRTVRLGRLCTVCLLHAAECTCRMMKMPAGACIYTLLLAYSPAACPETARLPQQLPARRRAARHRDEQGHGGHGVPAVHHRLL